MCTAIVWWWNVCLVMCVEGGFSLIFSQIQYLTFTRTFLNNLALCQTSMECTTVGCLSAEIKGCNKACTTSVGIWNTQHLCNWCRAISSDFYNTDLVLKVTESPWNSFAFHVWWFVLNFPFIYSFTMNNSVLGFLHKGVSTELGTFPWRVTSSVTWNYYASFALWKLCYCTFLNMQ